MISAKLLYQWCPCSEGLPEKDGVYLVTREGWPEATICAFEKGEWNTSSHFGCFGYVLAWMSLPDIYRGELTRGITIHDDGITRTTTLKGIDAETGRDVSYILTIKHGPSGCL